MAKQRSKVISSTLSFCGNTLTPSDHVLNLGVTFDPDLSLKTHISSVCRSSFYHIRQIRIARPSLDTNSAILLANALVSSKLDYCNSLYAALPASSIHRLQLVQNALARAVVPSVRRFQHIKPILHNLHWLPVNQRITYKIAALTFKTLHHKEPSYLVDLLLTHAPSRNLRSSDKHLLTIPYIKSSIGRRSFFFLVLQYGIHCLFVFACLTLHPPFLHSSRLIFFLHRFSCFLGLLLWLMARYRF